MEGLSEPVRNGQTGTVVRVGADGAVRIRFDGQDKRTATIRLKPEMDVVPVGLGYVMSTTKYQGGQAPVVLVTPGSPEIASQNSGYSQTTRMVEHVEVLVDKQRWDRGEGPIKTLGQAWSTPEVKTMASELLSEPKIEHEYVAPELVEHFEDSWKSRWTSAVSLPWLPTKRSGTSTRSERRWTMAKGSGWDFDSLVDNKAPREVDHQSSSLDDKLLAG